MYRKSRFDRKSKFLESKTFRQFDIEHDCRRGSEYSFERENSMASMLIISLNDMHLNQDHDYQYHIFFEQNTRKKLTHPEVTGYGPDIDRKWTGYGPGVGRK